MALLILLGKTPSSKSAFSIIETMDKILSVLLIALFTINSFSQSLREIGALESKIESLQRKNKNVEAAALMLELGDLYRSNNKSEPAENEYKNALITFKDHES